MALSSDNPSSVPVVFLTWLVVSYTFACANRGSLEKHGGRFLNEAYLWRTYLQGRMHVLAKTDAKWRLFPQTFAGAVYNVCIRGCKRYPWRTHVFAFKVDQIGPGGCSALRGRLQCTASEMGKTGTEIVSPILDKRKGRRDTPHMGHSSPHWISTEPRLSQA